MVGSASKQYLRARSKPVTLLFILRTTKEEKMRFGQRYMWFIGLTLTLLSAELWLIGGLAAQKSRIAFSNLVFDNYEIYVMDADGGNRENLSNHPVDDMEPNWSPDGRKIAFISNRNGGVYQIYVMDADGGNQTRLTDGPWGKREPVWSPDGRKIAFTVQAGRSRIDVMDADGKNRVSLVGKASSPSWSPDGQQILFVLWRDGHHEFFMIGADGKGLERFKQGLGGHSPSFSPDGERIAYYEGIQGLEHIFVVEVDGKNPKRLTHNRRYNSHPTWSPDGGAIAYVVSKDDFWRDATIHLMTADGKHLKQLSNVHDGIDLQPDFSPVGLAVSPTSKTTTTWGRLKMLAPDLR